MVFWHTGSIWPTQGVTNPKPSRRYSKDPNSQEQMKSWGWRNQAQNHKTQTSVRTAAPRQLGPWKQAHNLTWEDLPAIVRPPFHIYFVPDFPQNGPNDEIWNHHRRCIRSPRLGNLCRTKCETCARLHAPEETNSSKASFLWNEWPRIALWFWKAQAGTGLMIQHTWRQDVQALTTLGSLALAL